MVVKSATNRKLKQNSSYKCDHVFFTTAVDFFLAATGAGLAAVEIRRLGAGLLALFCSELSAMEMRRTLYIISSTEFCTIPFSAVCRRGLFLFLLVVGVGDSNADATG